MLGMMPLGSMSAPAQTPPRASTQTPAENPRSNAPPASLEGIKQRDKELEALRAEQRKALENEARLKREIESIGDDRRKFNQQIIESAARVVNVEERIAKAQERLAPLDDNEQALRRSLEHRRSLIAEVLAALQRMGRQAPPGLMIRAEDALQSVRSAMMLGAVLPEMRQQAETLAGDLAELVRLRKQIAEERETLDRDLRALATDQLRLSLFIEQRQKRQTEVEQALTEERQRAAQLAREAENLNQLIAKLEQGLDHVTGAVRPGTRSTEDRKAIDGRPNLVALNDPGRLSPAIAFGSAKGMLPLPVNGPESGSMAPPTGSGAPRRAFP